MRLFIPLEELPSHIFEPQLPPATNADESRALVIGLGPHLKAIVSALRALEVAHGADPSAVPQIDRDACPKWLHGKMAPAEASALKFGSHVSGLRRLQEAYHLIRCVGVKCSPKRAPLQSEPHRKLMHGAKVTDCGSARQRGGAVGQDDGHECNLWTWPTSENGSIALPEKDPEALRKRVQS